MNRHPRLSIVTPTRGNFTPSWYEALRSVRGDVEFVMVYPPGVSPESPHDERVRVLVSNVRSEFSQRLLGLEQAQGEYVLALDDDDYVHPDVADLTDEYFALFSSSWLLRLFIRDVSHANPAALAESWEPTPAPASLPIHTAPHPAPDGVDPTRTPYLLELPIAPLENRFRLRHALPRRTPRTDMQGVHSENFTNRVWLNSRLKPVLADLSLELARSLTVLPRDNLDRSLGLYIQAFYFERGCRIGHWLRGPAQIRRVHRPAASKEHRNHFWADSLLVRRFPQYGYFWNLFFWSMYQAVNARFSPPRQADPDASALYAA